MLALWLSLAACTAPDDPPRDDADTVPADDTLVVNTGDTSTSFPPDDRDGDGLVDEDEALLGTDPADPDTDHDTVPDGAEVRTFGTDPLWDETAGGPDCADPTWLPFDASQPIDPGLALGAHSATAADLDGDGDLDVMAANSIDDGSGGHHGVWWYENAGDGTMVAAHAVDQQGEDPRYVEAADLDGDGALDLLVVMHGDHEVVWFQGDGSGGFSSARAVNDVPAIGAWNAQAIDIDGDGDLDVFVASGGDDTVAWYANVDGAGTFGPRQVIASCGDGVDYPYSVTGADFDGDGDPDVLFAADETVWWAKNQVDTAGSFAAAQVIHDRSNALRSVAAADLDGDGLVDALSGSASQDKVAWYRNLGGGRFAPVRTISVGRQNGVRAVHVDDIDLDGDIDVFAASKEDNTLAWYENQGGARFTEPQFLTRSFDTWWISTADLDGDGFPDIFGAASRDSTIPVFLNRRDPDSDGDGLSTGAERCIVGSDPDRADSDGGGVDDGAEVAAGTDPLDGADDLQAAPAPGAVVGGADSDGDGLLDVDEWAVGSNPRWADSDLDGLPDGDELGDVGSPANTDGDALIDLLDDDDDGDGINTRQEVGGVDPKGTPDPTNPDSHALTLVVSNGPGDTVDLTVTGAPPDALLLAFEADYGLSAPLDEIGGATMGILVPPNPSPVAPAMVASAAGEATFTGVPIFPPGARLFFQAVVACGDGMPAATQPPCLSDPDNSLRSNVEGNDYDGSEGGVCIE